MSTTLYHTESNTDNAVTYSRESYMYGGGWISYEKGVVQGTVRVINGILSQASSIHKRRFKKDKVMWSSIDPKCLRNVDINERVKS